MHDHQYLKARLPRGNIASESNQCLPYWSVSDHPDIKTAICCIWKAVTQVQAPDGDALWAHHTIFPPN